MFHLFHETQLLQLVYEVSQPSNDLAVPLYIMLPVATIAIPLQIHKIRRNGKLNNSISRTIQYSSPPLICRRGCNKREAYVAATIPSVMHPAGIRWKRAR